MKARRQKAILDLVQHQVVRSQEQLRRRLKALGFVATQATLSRDIRDLGLVKRAADSAYQRPVGEPASPAAALTAFERALTEYAVRVAQVQHLLVIHTGRGQAQPLAEAIDRAELAEIAGTIAGDDTILVVARSAPRARTLLRRCQGLLRR
jgi:transcriptional regulator of arginine metabolism